jgi:23S rRNA (adenine1618-N6)-methyltransferase
MEKPKKTHPKIKSRLHPRNKHRERYNFKELTKSCPELEPFVIHNKYGDESVDFFNPKAVKLLNKALLKHFYHIDNWDIPSPYLVPPIPGRADYIHFMADLLSQKNFGQVPRGKTIRCLDVGMGANSIYPLIGIKEYAWSFVGAEIDSEAIAIAEKIKNANPEIDNQLEIRHQKKYQDVFFGILEKGERFEMSICNPPFHRSHEEAEASNLSKLNKLKKGGIRKSELNFGGHSSELFCEGGEEKFIKNMIRESKFFDHSIFWFSSIISKKSNLKKAYASLKKVEASEVKTIPMGQGNKSSRILAWTFLSPEEQAEWAKNRWQG